MAEDLTALAQACAGNSPNPRAIWLFDGSPSYVVFELIPSRSIAACIRFDGSLRVPDADAT
jgi:hypothetical protein